MSFLHLQLHSHFLQTHKNKLFFGQCFRIVHLIQFDREETQTMLGIYSFNLGRGAYYNMGFRFMKDFTTNIKNTAGEYVDNKIPAFVTSYHTYAQDELF